MKKIFYLFVYAAAVSALFSCVKGNEYKEEATHREVILTTTLTKDNTKAIAPDGKTSWKVGEKVQVRYTNTSNNYQFAEGEVTSVTDAGGAVITATLLDPMEGNNYAYFRFPYSRYSGAKNINLDQAGTLADIGENFDLSEGGGDMVVAGGVATLPGGVTMTNYITIWHLTFAEAYAGYRVAVSGGASYKVTPVSPTNEIYVAMRGVSSKEITIFAMDASGNLYQKTATATLNEKTLYNTTIGDMGTALPTETVSAASITSEHVGYILGADGNAYSHVMAAEFAGTTTSGIIAYVGTNPDDSWAGYNVMVLQNGYITTSNWQYINTGIMNATAMECSSTVSGNDISTLLTSKKGFADTQLLVSAEHKDHRHNAEQMVTYLNGAAPEDSYYSSWPADAIARPASSSPWFIPSAGQWNLMVKALVEKAGGTAVDLTSSTNSSMKASVFNPIITKAGAESVLDSRHHSSSEYHSGSSYGYWTFVGSDGRLGWNQKTSSWRIRAVFVYKPTV